MRAVSPLCDNCRAPLRVSPTAQQVICAACGAWLAVVRTEDGIRTRLISQAPGSRMRRGGATGYTEGEFATGALPDEDEAVVPDVQTPPSGGQAVAERVIQPAGIVADAPSPEGQAAVTSPATAEARRPGHQPAPEIAPGARKQAPAQEERPAGTSAPAAVSVAAPIPESAAPERGDVTRHAPTEPARSSHPFLSLAGGLAGLALAGAGEWFVEIGSTSPLSLLLYLAGIALFAVSAWFMPPAAEDLPETDSGEPRPATNRRRAWIILGAGVALAVALNVIALFMIHDNLGSIPGIYLWLASVLVIAAAGIASGSAFGWPARWKGGVLPAGRGERMALIAAVVIILVIASAARLIALDKVPFGINADEGDRAATSIQILRGDNTESIFGNGWYFISNVYFWLLAQLMRLIGVGFAQARVFGALASIVSVAAITWIGIRHFSVRVGLMAGALLSVLSISLQFARETSEAGPTAMLWAVSFALMLEGARTGKAWAWICSGLAGGFSLYFYPSARLWAVVAAGFTIYLLVHGLGGRRWGILWGGVLAGVAALIIAGPFLVHTMPIFSPAGGLDMFTIRAQETSIFTANNPTRLNYYDPSWNMAQLLAAQVDRSVGMFNQYHDDGGFWPTDRPVMWGLLAILTLLGVGWASTRWRDPRYVLLALWFWTGLAGVIVTVETPNVQRFAAAVPALALFPALVIDNLTRRLEALVVRWRFRDGESSEGEGVPLSWLTAGPIAAIVFFLAWSQFDFYFNVYGNTDRWPQPTIQGQSVNDQGSGTLVVSVAREFHQVNSGWVRLLAPFTPRGGDRNPGLDLPLNVPAGKNLAFMLYPNQTFYQGYLSSIYPGGATTPYIHPTEGLVVEMYKVPQDKWAATQGAMAHVGESSPARVGTLGELPRGLTTFPVTITWTAGLRADRYWNYEFKAPAVPARLSIDGVPVFDTAGGGSALATVSLAAGLHYVEYEATLNEQRQSGELQWAPQPGPGQDSSGPELAWAAITPEQLYAPMPGPQGLLGVVQAKDGDRQLTDERRLDGTLAFCCPTSQLTYDGRPFTASWTGSLTAPATGVYSMTLFAQGAVELKIDGQIVMHSDGPGDANLGAGPNLTAGPHSVQVDLDSKGGPGGLEWAWMPPGGERSIVPPSALSPPQHAGIGSPLDQNALSDLGAQPRAGSPLETVP